MRKTSDIIWQDAQHQVLFEVLDLLKEPNAGPELLYRLEAYTENHFALEEQYMRQLNYPDRVAHVQAVGLDAPLGRRAVPVAVLEAQADLLAEAALERRQQVRAQARRHIRHLLRIRRLKMRRHPQTGHPA